jgi:enamine deaminase RidA (YjgF/YER057c/UK114 family)/carbonic anhydrase/acetyltransferase-like protein (isoleucine patch superfamily)
VLFGAVVTAEGGPVEIGESTVVMEQAVVRGRERHSTSIGDHVIVGPHAHVNGATVEDEAFLATGSSVFMGARVGAGAEVRINGVVQVNTHLPAEGLVPIGWVAVGDPAEVLPPGDHERIWSIQRELDFPGTAFGLPRAPARELLPAATARYAETFGRHREDRVLGGDPGFERFSSETRWERAVGYSRAVRAGSLVFVAGTTATGEDGVLVGEGDAYAQTRHALANVEAALRQAGAVLADVVQTRLYVRDIARWEEVGRAHAEVFGEIRPVTAMVEVSALVDPRMLVEVEATAFRV